VLALRSPLVACVSSPWWREDTVCATATTFRAFRCRRCDRETLICTRCDRGQHYCTASCATASRRERVRHAGQQYQQTEQGAERNAIRQKRFRTRHPTTVTHQGSPPPTAPAQEIAIAPLVVERPQSQVPGGSDGDADDLPFDDPQPIPARCHFCGRVLGAFVRMEAIGRRRRHHRSGGVIP
jgi:hypothetical protein